MKKIAKLLLLVFVASCSPPRGQPIGNPVQAEIIQHIDEGFVGTVTRVRVLKTGAIYSQGTGPWGNVGDTIMIQVWRRDSPLDGTSMWWKTPDPRDIP